MLHESDLSHGNKVNKAYVLDNAMYNRSNGMHLVLITNLSYDLHFEVIFLRNAC